MYQKAKKTLETIILSIPLIFNNCNVIERFSEDEINTKLRNQGYNPYHITACGPTVLKTIIDNYNLTKLKEIKIKELSKEIIKNHNFGSFLRNALSIIDKNAQKITWPWEVENILIKYFNAGEYKLTIYKNSPLILKERIVDLILENKTGIALVKEKGDSRSFHWAYFTNPNMDIFNCYNKLDDEGNIIKKGETRILKIYLIEKYFPKNFTGPINNTTY